MSRNVSCGFPLLLLLLVGFLIGGDEVRLIVEVNADAPMNSAPPEQDGMVSLFNGSDLSGWEGDPRLWSVKDGVIYGETTKEHVAEGNTFLIWKDGSLKDFELRLSFKCNATNNSGIQYRSARVKDGSNPWVVKGYQHEVRNENIVPNVPGFIYDEKGSRGRICNAGEKVLWTSEGKQQLSDELISAEEMKSLVRIDDWNEVVIIAEENHIRHFLNGRLIVDFTDEHPEKALFEGVLALQLHAGKPMWTSFRNIRLREIK